MKKIINSALENRPFVLLAAAALLFTGIYSLNRIKLDAIPDLSDVQVILQADFRGQPPQVIEDQVTYPLTTRMLSVPGASNVRGYSFFGFSLVYIIFEDGTDLYYARSRVLEYMSSIQGALPDDVNLKLGPDATSIGWIYQYALKDTSGRQTLADLRSLQDFYLNYELTALEGVSEIAPVGGFRRQFQVEINPDLMIRYNITIEEVKNALKKGNLETGARLFEQAETEYMVLARGYIRNTEDIAAIPVRAGTDGAVLTLSDIAHITQGPELRRGLADLNGEGETVGGIVVMRRGEDVTAVIERVKKRLSELEPSLPEGVEIVTVYDRSELIEEAVSNLMFKLIEELAVVALITFLFLLHMRSAAVALVVLPLSVLGSFSLMYVFDLTANIMSLGGIAIAIGVMVDASVVIVENAHKHLEKTGGSAEERIAAVKESVHEVAPGLFWSLVIIIVSFLPVFALPEQSGRMFIPLALTKTFAMTVAAVISVTLLPVLAVTFIRGRIHKESEHPVSRVLSRIYRPFLVFSLDHKKTVLIIAAAIALISIVPFTGIPTFSEDEYLIDPIGSEFMPPLEEGDLLYMPTTIPGISIAKAREILIQTDRLIKEVHEVKTVFGKIGRADTPTDPAPLTMIETTILLKDRSQWREGVDIEHIKNELNAKVQLPGLVNAWTMPIRTRIDMLSTGIKTPVGVKIMGDDLEKLQQLAQRLETELKNVEDVSSVFGERTRGGNYIIYEIDRRRAAMYGLNIADIHSVIGTALGGRKVTDIIDGAERYSANIRYLRSYRDSIDDLNSIFIPLKNGRGQIPVSAVLKEGSIQFEKGPAVIKTENARKTSWLYVDTRSSDIGRLVDNVRSHIDGLIESGRLEWPAGYSYKISGRFEQMQKAADRMQILLPVVLLIVLLILYIHFKNLINPLLVMTTALLFAPAGGIWLMYAAGFNRSVATDVGFIALIGLAAETGVLMLIYLEEELAKRRDTAFSSLRNAVLDGSIMRLRPKIMTVMTTMLGLLPLFWGSEPGNTAMRRIASPMVGGLVSSTLVTLILLPVLFEWYHGRRRRTDFYQKNYIEKS